MSMSAQKDRHTFRVGTAEWCGAGGAPGLGHCRILVKHDVSTCQCSSNLEIRQDHASVLWPPCPRMQDVPRRNHHRQINPQTNKAHDTSLSQCWRMLHGGCRASSWVLSSHSLVGFCSPHPRCDNGKAMSLSQCEFGLTKIPIRICSHPVNV